MGQKASSLAALNQQEELIAGRTAFGNPSSIIDYLFLGSAYNAVDEALLEQLKITHILNVAEECTSPPPKSYSSLKLIVNDMVGDELEFEKQFQTFQKAFKFIEAAEKQQKGVLVHCMRGRSRSATIVIAYLMQKNDWKLNEAYEFVKSKRSIIGPHRHLQYQLKKYELTLYPNLNTSTMEGIW